jgi:hypothetical protein
MLKAYIYIYIDSEDMYSGLNSHYVAKYTEFYLKQLRFNVISNCTYSKRYYVASVTKTFTLKGVQTVRRSTLFIDLLHFYNLLKIHKESN